MGGRKKVVPDPIVVEPDIEQQDDAISKRYQVSTLVGIQSIRPAIKELERLIKWAYARTGDRAKDDQIHDVVVTIQTQGKQATLCGWTAYDAWGKRDSDETYHEINFTAEMLQRDPYDILATGIHEVAHLMGQDFGEKTCSAGGRHNMKFKEIAETLGLNVEMAPGSKGWAATTLTDELRKEIEEDFKPNLDALRLFRNIKLVEKKEPNTVAYICDCEDKDDQVPIRISKGKAEAFEAKMLECHVCGSEFHRKED